MKQTTKQLLGRVTYFNIEFTHTLNKKQFLAAARNGTLINIHIYEHDMKVELDVVLSWRGAPRGYLFSGKVVMVDGTTTKMQPPISGHIVFRSKKGWSDLEIIPAQLSSVF